MSKCRDIQTELSAYVDDELLPSQRTEVDEHVASCSRCQKELAELQSLALGMAALPKLKPAPRFLADVRLKIIRGDRPEPLAWQDYLFRPFWLKVPVEVVVVIAVVALVTKYEEPPPLNKPSNGPYQMTYAQNSDRDRNDGIVNKTAPAAELQPAQAPAEQTASTASAGGGQTANSPAPQAESLSRRDSAPSNTTGGEAKHTFDGLAGSGSTAPTIADGNAGFENRRQATVSAALRGTDTLPPPTAPNAAALAQDVGIDPSKLGGVVIVDGKSASDMRRQAEQLAARCNGTIIAGPQSKDFTGQVFFVEVPQEYAATFKLEMARLSHASSTTDATMLRDESGAITGAAPASAAATGAITGVLTGTRNTNALAVSSTAITMADIKQSLKPATVVLEIVVVPPKK